MCCAKWRVGRWQPVPLVETRTLPVIDRQLAIWTHRHMYADCCDRWRPAQGDFMRAPLGRAGVRSAGLIIRSSMVSCGRPSWKN